MLPERLKTARESISKSQKEMAEALGVGLKSWQVYEQGGSVPGGNVFESLVKLGFNANWLLTGEGEMRRGEGAQPELMQTVQQRLNAAIQKQGVTLSTEKGINLFVTLMRIFDGNYKDPAFRELVMDSMINNLVKLTLPEK